MKFVFWQVVVSLHQAAFIRELALRGHDVTFIASRALSRERIDQGWSAEYDHGSARILIAGRSSHLPGDVLAAFDNQTVHIISGVGSTDFERDAIALAHRTGGRVVCWVEPWQLTSLPRTLYWWVRTRNRIRHIAACGGRFLTTGRDGEMQLRRSGVREERIAPFAYWLEPSGGRVAAGRVTPGAHVSILFVGSLNVNKNILPLIDAVTAATGLAGRRSIRLTIVGSGPLEEDVSRLADEHPESIEFRGSRPNAEVRELMAQHDFLALPSAYDGWGAVVSEALLTGTRVLVSQAAGSAQVVTDSRVGVKFPGTKSGIAWAIDWAAVQGPTSRTDRLELRSWAEAAVSSRAGAEYFENLVEAWGQGARQLPRAPWA